MMRAPAIAQSMSFSVRMEAQAMEVVQPRQRKRASEIRPSTMRAESLRMSPQTGLLTLDGGGGAGEARRRFEDYGSDRETASVNIP